MGPCGDFGNNAAEARVQIDLRRDDVGEDAQVVGEDGDGGFVTGGFDGEEVHVTRRASLQSRKRSTDRWSVSRRIISPSRSRRLTFRLARRQNVGIDLLHEL